jgi:hypothetical protein
VVKILASNVINAVFIAQLVCLDSNVTKSCMLFNGLRDGTNLKIKSTIY